MSVPQPTNEYEILIESDGERGEVWYFAHVWLLDRGGERTDAYICTGSLDTRHEATTAARALATKHARSGNWEGKPPPRRGETFTVEVVRG